MYTANSKLKKQPKKAFKFLAYDRFHLEKKRSEYCIIFYITKIIILSNCFPIS